MIALKFTQHEIWALKWAGRLPLFGLFFCASLWVWMIVPTLLISPILILMLESSPILFAVVGLLAGLPITIVGFVWLCRWYVICVGLLLGKRQMFKTKMNTLEQRLARLAS